VQAPSDLPALSPLRRFAGRLHFSLRERGVVQAFALLGLALSALAIRLTPARESRQVRLARRLARSFGRLRGPFAKLGQFASLRVDAVAPEARAALEGLRDRVPPIPFHWVRAQIEAELGAPLSILYERIDPNPLGAASIAQVHAALLPGGQPVAVKVQYPWLARSLPVDLALLRLAVRAGAGSASARSPWLAEFASGLAEELDFAREAAAAREVAANLAAETQVVVPRVIDSHSSARVLTMERLPTVTLDALDARGIPRRPVLETIVRAYARQIFEDGLFHADPHPGNLFVIDEPEAVRAPRVLFVDFGLCKRLRPELVRELRQGMLALLRRDLDAFVAGMARIGAVAQGAEPRVREAVASVFARLAGEAGGPLALSGSRVLALKDEAKRLLYETPGLTLPSDLLLYAKTLSYLFALAREIAPEVDPMPLTVPWLLRFLAVRDPVPTSASASGGPAAG
jgi:predicted unusual protein kinase regulating ubiquinone biosynthesis (AarF/ABC1/UbiB family)